ncbi:ATP-dependent RNA helicase DDX54 [Cylas formicarius]|uniref:ATP-dependent RNA helicase DDX54 n=1 Tax=Cylas formicarius TaxID=197179 RepID=UPI002958A1E9|nr:ATP-dependent RNA helicase DDX54 [Cylas formicarius]
MEVPGFEAGDTNDEAIFNMKPSQKSRKTGGFQSMNLSITVLKGITKRGYKQPTPIQRKTIPLILEGRDIVGMARTGSGKTAAFLIPMFEKLKSRQAKTGARALILSPTRELALQTLKFIKEIGRFVGLKAAVILGGDSMEDQFSVIHGNPDVIVATPGRFLHICIEMELKLNCVEYVVFDEADRLFEMGLSEQLGEILTRLPDARQTVLFSATLPKVLVEFSKAGLSDPVLIRLDLESKLPEELKLCFFTVRHEEKVAALLVLLKSVVKKDQQTVVFAATKYHVEYLHTILEQMGLENAYIYSDLDPSARKINAAKFSLGKVKILIVTDVAARGIDIPQLDNVINFNFPAKPKLFVHRVGRCARAGRSGTAYSLVASNEYAHLLDLHLFLGRPMPLATTTNADGAIGRIPQSLLEDQMSSLLIVENRSDVQNLQTTADNGYKQYLRSRQAASAESNRNVKDLPWSSVSVHPIFGKLVERVNLEGEHFMDRMKAYRPQGTIFEICGKNKSQEYLAMKEKRAAHKQKILDHRRELEEKMAAKEQNLFQPAAKLQTSNEEDISRGFSDVVVPKRMRMDSLYTRKRKGRDVFVPYASEDRHAEEGLLVNNFQKEAKRAELELVADSEQALKMTKQMKRWDRKKKKMVNVEDPRKGKIRTESGVWIPATYKTNRYADWKEKTKKTIIGGDDIDDEDRSANRNAFSGRKRYTHWAKHNEKVKTKQMKSEMKSTGQILKAREIAERKKQRSKKKTKRTTKRKKTQK